MSGQSEKDVLQQKSTANQVTYRSIKEEDVTLVLLSCGDATRRCYRTNSSATSSMQFLTSYQ
eukprot:2188708-Amphidinium_carterae.1